MICTRNGKRGKDFDWPTAASLGGGLAESNNEIS